MSKISFQLPITHSYIARVANRFQTNVSRRAKQWEIPIPQLQVCTKWNNFVHFWGWGGGVRLSSAGKFPQFWAIFGGCQITKKIITDWLSSENGKDSKVWRSTRLPGWQRTWCEASSTTSSTRSPRPSSINREHNIFSPFLFFGPLLIGPFKVYFKTGWPP